MATENWKYWHAIGIPDIETFNPDQIDSANSSYSEASYEVDVTRGGSNVMDSSGQVMAELHATGTPTTSTTLDLTVQEPGYPDEAAGFLYSDDSNTTKYGWNRLNIFCGVETSIYDASADGYREPRMVVLPNGKIIEVIEDWTGTDTIACFQRTTAAVWSLLATVLTPSISWTTSRHGSPDIVRIKGGRLLVFSIERVTSGDTSSWVRIDYSDDDGATWGKMAQKVLELASASTRTYEKLRVAYDEQSEAFTLGVVENNGGTYTGRYYVSTTGGTSWLTGDTISDVRSHDLRSVCGVTVITYVTNAATFQVKRKAGNSKSWTDVTAPSATWHTDYMALCVLPNGWLAAYGRETGDANLVRCIVSVDGGFKWGTLSESWPPDGGNSETVANDTPSDTTTLTSGIAPNSAVWHDCGVFVAGNLASASIDYTGYHLIFGSPSNVAETDRYTTQTWYSSDVPASKGWATTGTAPTIVNQNGAALNVTTAAASSTHAYNPGASATIAKVKARIDTNASGSLADNRLVLELQVNDTPNTSVFRARLRFSGSTVELFDVAGGSLGASVATQTGAFDVLMAASEAVAGATGTVSAWWKPATSYKWIPIAVDQTLVAAGGSNYEVLFGHNASSTLTSYWYFCALQIAIDQRLDSGFTQNNNTGIPIPSEPMRLPSSISVFGRGGPFSTADTYQANSRSKQGVNRMISTTGFSSPRQGYVSGTGLSGGGTSYIQFTSPAGYSRLGEVVGVAVLSGDFTSVKLRNQAGTDIVDLDPREYPMAATGIAWTRDAAGDTWFRPNGANGVTSAGKGRYFRPNELKGAIVGFVDNAAYELKAEVIENTEGQFSTTSGVKQMAIRLHATPLAGVYATLATSATTGQLQVRWRDALGMAVQSASSNGSYQIRWTRPAETTQDKFGKIVVFRAALIPTVPDPGSQHTIRANDEVVTLPYGFKRGRRLAPAGRVVRFPFRQLCWFQTRYKGSQVIAAAGPGSTMRGVWDNAADVLLATIEQVGESRPIIYAHGLEITADLTTQLTLYGKRDWIYGRVAAESTVTMSRGQRWGAADTVRANHQGDVEVIFVEEV